ncbi:MAG: hypothetical protein RI967_1737, partial [Planctomycetota bacterium]
MTRRARGGPATDACAADRTARDARDLTRPRRHAACGTRPAAALAMLALAAGSPPAEVAPAMPRDGRLGGPATVAVDGPHAFSLPIPGLSREERRAFSVGNSFFRDNWVAAPASAEGRDGLGPLFNANSCSACHADDGRGRPPADGERGTGLVVFASPREADGAPHLVYGHQLQDQAIDGVAPEVSITLAPRVVRGAYGDGTPYELVDWRIALADAAYGPLGDLRLSPRIGQQLVGVGLLEAVDDAAILAREDLDDRDGDGISGRAHRVTGADGTRGLGRFGWKASQPTLEAQVVAALHEDIGITSDARPGEALSTIERGAITAPSGGAPEIDARKIARIAHYCRVLAVPAQRGGADDAGRAAIARGARLFADAGCAACHAPTMRTGPDSPIALLREVEFHPFTDLLLHDMGDGLADDRRDGDASGREWRTAPLWGIGLVET